MAPPPVAMMVLDAIGIEAICSRIQEGEMMTAICADIGVSLTSLATWFAADPERALRANQARMAAADAYVEAAEQAILDCIDPAMMTRARELAHHRRWRASKMNPRRYGDRVTQEITGADGGPIQTAAITIDASALDPDQRAALRAALTAGSGGS